MKKTLTYIKNFIRDKQVASITPSSRFCVKRVCKHVDLSEKRFIIEYGPGTGVYTNYLLSHMNENSILYAFEVNNEFVKKLKLLDDPKLEIHHAGAEKLPEKLGAHIKGKVDYIISGIPFSFLSSGQRNKILMQSYEYLKPGGLFLAYQTSTHLKDSLETYFDSLETEFELLNLPPMVVYVAAKNPNR